jgi:hypothetical protein
VEVVERRVVVELDCVRALGQRSAVQVLAVWVLELDREVVLDMRGQHRKVVLRSAELPGRILLPDPEHVVHAGRLAHDVHVTAGVLAE